MLGVHRGLLPVKAGDVVEFVNLGDCLKHRVRFYVNDTGRTICWKWFWSFNNTDGNGVVPVDDNNGATCLRCVGEED